MNGLTGIVGGTSGTVIRWVEDVVPPLQPQSVLIPKNVGEDEARQQADEILQKIEN